MFGLDNDWAKRAIMASGNYGEIFAANIGEGTPSQHRPRPERPVDVRAHGLRDPRGEAAAAEDLVHHLERVDVGVSRAHAGQARSTRGPGSRPS